MHDNDDLTRFTISQIDSGKTASQTFINKSTRRIEYPSLSEWPVDADQLISTGLQKNVQETYGDLSRVISVH